MTGLPKASNKCHRFPVPHRGMPDQALSARAPTIEPHHVGGDRRFIECAGSSKPARGSSVGAPEPRRLVFALPPAGFFLTVMPWRAKKRDNALRLPGIRRLCSAETISRRVRSGCSPIKARICSACSPNGEVLPPRGIGSAVPSSRKRSTHLIAELTLTSYCSAACVGTLLLARTG